MGHWAEILARSTEQLTLCTAGVHCADYIKLFNQVTPFQLVYALQCTMYIQLTLCTAGVHFKEYIGLYNQMIPLCSWCTLCSVH